MYSQNDWRLYQSDELYHHGIKGQKWGVRRYQNSDGSLTDEGRKRYGSDKQSYREYVSFPPNGGMHITTTPPANMARIPNGPYNANGKLTKAGKEFQKQIDNAYDNYTKFDKYGYEQADKVKSYEDWNEAYSALYWSRFERGSIEDRLLRNYRNFCEDGDRFNFEDTKRFVKGQLPTMSKEQEEFFDDRFETDYSKNIWSKADLTKGRKYESSYYDADPNSKQYKDLYKGILAKAREGLDYQLLGFSEIEADGDTLTKEQREARKECDDLLKELDRQKK